MKRNMKLLNIIKPYDACLVNRVDISIPYLILDLHFAVSVPGSKTCSGTRMFLSQTSKTGTLMGNTSKLGRDVTSGYWQFRGQ